MAGSPHVLSGTFAGRYTIERELGHGATATVYLARDTQRGRSVAIKVLRTELAETVGAERFLREIKLNEQLQHPHIVHVLDSGQHEGQLYFVLPWMEGGSLRQMLERERQLPIEKAVAITRTVADALHYAHEKGLIHRDVKPENILFSSGQACLADFGIARAIERAIDASTTETGLVRGTPAYMSPEQASGSRQYDGRSDQYSLACVLYEVLAGMQAFIGPTAEMIIAQRFQHTPRELRVYRPSVPKALEQVIVRALSLSPADRYENAAEFSAALDAAMHAPQVEPRTSGPTFGFARSKKKATIGATVFVLALVTLATVGGPMIWGKRPAADNTRYVVLPIESEPGLPAAQSYDLLLQAFSRWKGMSVVDRFSLLAELGSDSSRVDDRVALSAAKELGAGRFVRTRLSRSEGGIRAYAAVFDARSKARLGEASAQLGVDLAGAEAALAGLTFRLLVPDADPSVAGSSHVGALQAYAAGSRAQTGFQFARAESLYSAAIEADRDFALAAARLAQVRSLMGQATPRWLTLAEMGAANTSIGERERKLTNALVAIGRSRFEDACRIYDELRRTNERDYAAWYGLGQCHARDNVVVQDRRSPSGWRYRSSSHRAILAYTRAFELAPELSDLFAPGAFRRLRSTFWTSLAVVRRGSPMLPETRSFWSYPSWSGDSLLFIPYPAADFFGRLAPNRQTRLLAITKQRERFAQLVRGWSASLPKSASAKEGVAVSLEMLGDPAAIDTIIAARSLATTMAHRVRLASEEVLFRIEFGRLDRAALTVAQQMGDSLLAHTPPDPAWAALLVPVASALGRCTQAASLAAKAIDPGSANDVGLPSFVPALSESVQVLAATACSPTQDSLGFARIADALNAAPSTRGVAQRGALETTLLRRAVSLSANQNEYWLTKVSAGVDPLLVAQTNALKGDTASVRKFLETRAASLGEAGTADLTPDVAFAEARLWLAIRDTARTIAWIDPILARGSWLDLMFEPVSVASVLRLAVLRADLALAQDDRVTAQTWSGFVAALWANADQPLKAAASTRNQKLQ